MASLGASPVLEGDRLEDEEESDEEDDIAEQSIEEEADAEEMVRGPVLGVVVVFST